MSSSFGVPRAVIDTNLVVSRVIIGQGPPRAMIEAWQRQEFRWLVTAPIRDEYADVVGRRRLRDRFGTPDEDVDSFFDLLALSAEDVQPVVALPIAVRDPKDEMVLAAALGGDADYLVTGDNDLLTLADDRQLGRLRIIPVTSFLLELEL